MGECQRPLNFNSHAHVERDTVRENHRTEIRISTHTLTWSVTNQVADAMIAALISTHTLTWSVTMRTYKRLKPHINFNSHAHVERDRMPLARLCCLDYFNSHAHVERDAINYLITALTAISTHTLTWSVTRGTRQSMLRFSNFNSHAHVERDFGILRQQGSNWKFQLTRSRGA